jgi:hypothetical protein
LLLRKWSCMHRCAHIHFRYSNFVSCSAHTHREFLNSFSLSVLYLPLLRCIVMNDLSIHPMALQPRSGLVLFLWGFLITQN